MNKNFIENFLKWSTAARKAAGWQKVTQTPKKGLRKFFWINPSFPGVILDERTIRL